MRHHQDACHIDFTVEAGKKYFVTTRKSWVQKQLGSFLKRYDRPIRGDILLGDHNLFDYDKYELRQAVYSLDRSLIVECTIEQFLKLSAPGVTFAQISEALDMVELTQVIDDLPDGLVTRIANLGTPLQPLEFLLLKLAAAILSGPQIVLLNQHFDAVPHALKARLLRRIYSMNWTVLYFTNMPVDGEFDGILALHDTLEVTAFTPNTAEEGTHE